MAAYATAAQVHMRRAGEKPGKTGMLPAVPICISSAFTLSQKSAGVQHFCRSCSHTFMHINVCTV